MDICVVFVNQYLYMTHDLKEQFSPVISLGNFKSISVLIITKYFVEGTRGTQPKVANLVFTKKMGV